MSKETNEIGKFCLITEVRQELGKHSLETEEYRVKYRKSVIRCNHLSLCILDRCQRLLFAFGNQKDHLEDLKNAREKFNESLEEIEALRDIFDEVIKELSDESENSSEDSIDLMGSFKSR